MTKPTLNKKIQAALNAALERMLDGLMVSDSWLDLRHLEELSDFSKALSEHDPWRSHFTFPDLLETIGRFFIRYKITTEPEGSVRLRDVLTPERFAQFSRDVRGFLLSLPRQYEVWVELPSMPVWGAGELPLTRSMTIVESEQTPLRAADAPMVALAAALNQQRVEPASLVQLRVLATGYAGTGLDTTAMQDAVSQMKQFFQLFRRLDIYEQKSPAIILGAMFASKKIRCVIVDPDVPDEQMMVALVALPEQLQRFLSTASINQATLQSPSKGILLGAERREATTRIERVESIKGKISRITKLMDCPPGDWPDAHRIRTAAEWSFDSKENDNQTLAFIQACIGLEALLGDDDDQEEPLTARLADRCAYLLGQSHRNRKGIRDKFKAMYKVRSKLVHGRSPRLNLPDSEQLGFAQTTLEEVITEEADRLLRALDRAK